MLQPPNKLAKIEVNNRPIEEVFGKGVSITYDPPRDGNCQFSAISSQLILLCGLHLSSSDLRQQVVNYLYSNAERLNLINFVPHQNVTIYLQKMSVNGTYGDHLTLMGMANLYNVQFVIYSSLGIAGRRIISNNIESKLIPSVPIIYLGHYAETEGEHYVCIKVNEIKNETSRQYDDRDINESKSQNVLPDAKLDNEETLCSSNNKDDKLDNEEMLCSNNNKEHKQSLKDVDLSNIQTAFHPNLSFKFPISKFGNQSRSCHSEWFKKWQWLHYLTINDSVICFLCAKAIQEKLVTVWHKRDPAFISVGFRNWKKATSTFVNHEKSEAHLEAADKIFSRKQAPISALLSEQVASQQIISRKALYLIFSCIKYLCIQGFPLRGHEHNDGALFNLVQERALDVPELREWFKRRDNWLSDTIQNEIVQIMAHAVQRDIMQEACKCKFFGVIADGTTDCSGQEQFSICIQYTSENFNVKNAFLGLYNSPDSTGKTLTRLIQDVFLRLNLPLGSVISFAFDGASNMSGKIHGVQALLKETCPDAHYIHCANHSLDLVLQEVGCNVRLIADALQFVKDCSNIIRESSKRRNLFASMFGDTDIVPSLKALCPTRWCIRASAIERIITTYKEVLESLKQIKDDANTRGDCKAKAAGLFKQGKLMYTYIALRCAHSIFSECDNVATVLQKESITMRGAMQAVDGLLLHLQNLRRDDFFDSVIKLAEANKEIKLEIPAEKRMRSEPARIRNNSKITAVDETSYYVKWRSNYFEAIDLINEELKRRFNQSSMKICIAREELLLISPIANEDDNVLNKTLEQACLPNIFDKNKLRRQLLKLHEKMSKESIPRKLDNIVKLLLEIDPAVRSMFSDIEMLACLILSTPVSAANAERSFSTLRRLKTWLRTAMSQKRLTHLALLTVHRNKLNKLDMNGLISQFIQTTPERVSIFGRLIC